MNKLIIILITTLLLLTCGCSSPASIATHQARVQDLRNQLPYLTRIGRTHSMDTVITPESTRTVSPYAYNKLQTGMVAVYWPMGAACPICHFTDRRIGTDSWSTHGMNQASDVTLLGYLLTRDNYIGIIK